jgi:glucose-1-phosphate thymidylyltransferase
VLDQLKDAGVKDIGIVVSADTRASIADAVGDGSQWDAKITLIMQHEQLGLAHAVTTAKDFLSDSPFIMFLGDNLIQGSVSGLVRQFDNSSPDALILLKKVADPRMFGVAELNEKGEAVRLVEKPKEPKSDLILVGVYLFSPAIHQAIAQIKPSGRGELEITDAIQKLIDMKKQVQTQILEGWWLDTGKKEDLLEANRIVLSEIIESDIQGSIDERSQIEGAVRIGAGTFLENCIIHGPVSIAQNCKIKNSRIGPFVSAGAGTILENTSIENTIVLGKSRIDGIVRLKDSLIGEDVEVVAREERDGIVRLFVGDDVKIEMS